MRIDDLKGIQLAVCGMKYIDLRNEAIKISVTCFSYNSTIKAFETIQIFFLWNNINSKIEHKTIWKIVREGLQNFNIRSKLTRRQIS